MELTYPYILYGGILITVIITVATIGKSKIYKKGTKNAGINIIDTIPGYRLLMIEYWVLRVFAVLSLITAIILSSYIAAKPVKVRTVTSEIHERDIFICLDVSVSCDGINSRLLEKIKIMITELKGERFGISIFNGKSVLLAPLTDDYEFIIDKIEALETSYGAGGEYYTGDNGATYEEYRYRFAGTEDSSGRGSSFIGEGLASCLYSFPDIDTETDRSRIILMVTDNYLNGEPIVTYQDACGLCDTYGVKVFAIAPDFIADEDSFYNATLSTGGGYYNTRDKRALERLVEDVRKTDNNSTVNVFTSATDVPSESYYALVVSISVLFYCTWRLKL